MVTIKDISKKSGVSIATVSKALNNYSDISVKTKDTIVKLAKEMGYVPNSSAQSLKTQHSYTIGIIFEDVTDYGLQHPLFSKILESYKNVIESKGYDIMFLAKNMGNQTGSYLQHSMRKQVDGILVLCEDFNSDEMIELYQSDIPTVLIDYSVPSAVTVTSNNNQGMEQGVRFLRDLGHKKIAHIYGDRHTYIGGQRKLAFEVSMRKFQLDLRELFMVSGQYFSKEDGYRAMQEILRLKDQPTAIFCASDMLAIGAIQAIKDVGKSVPEDYSIVGFDGVDIGQMITPKLTTIKQDARKMGEIAARKTLQYLIHPATVQSGDIITVDTYLINGDSTKILKD
ncbi:MAG: LacI family transcriptional regulator [Candidatus Izimaplasma sp.]|nr:LacI family transcriptional regulator [Candidatus Izimaplasma bacterium]